MKLTIISGRSGSGKSISLRLFEDLGYYCIDNLPISLLPELETKIYNQPEQVAVSIDARNISAELDHYHEVLRFAQSPNSNWEILYFDADDKKLIQRFSETRRKHPLTNESTTLPEAILAERTLLEPLANLADLIIDTTNTTTPELRELLSARVHNRPPGKTSILFQSFGFKHGIPSNADFVFDVRALPNPYWQPELADLTGKDKPVQAYLQSSPLSKKMCAQIKEFLDSWLPEMEANNRRYLTIAIGCTGGQHRSVYTVEELAKACQDLPHPIQIRHRELTK